MDNYHIYEEIGRGQGSVVYKGRKKKSIEYVAIKSVDKVYKPKILNEVHVLYGLDHPNILKFVNWYETTRHIWLIVEYCAGGNLREILAQDVQLPEQAILTFAKDILWGLHYVHAQGYLYCDLKPSNLLVNEFGMLKLCDFGLAQAVPGLKKGSEQKMHSKRGTPYYMAPELFSERGVHSYASDIWSFGCVLYELYTGRPPFASRSVKELVHAILTQEHPPLQSPADDVRPNTPEPLEVPLSPEFKDLVDRCLCKDPFERITWKELSAHPFLGGALLESTDVPSQPVFEALRSAMSSASRTVASHTPSSTLPHGPSKLATSPTSTPRATNVANSGDANVLALPDASGVDVLRLSRNAKFHLLQEREVRRSAQQSVPTDEDDLTPGDAIDSPGAAAQSVSSSATTVRAFGMDDVDDSDEEDDDEEAPDELPDFHRTKTKVLVANSAGVGKPAGGASRLKGDQRRVNTDKKKSSGSGAEVRGDDLWLADQDTELDFGDSRPTIDPMSAPTSPPAGYAETPALLKHGGFDDFTSNHSATPSALSGDSADSGLEVPASELEELAQGGVAPVLLLGATIPKIGSGPHRSTTSSMSPASGSSASAQSDAPKATRRVSDRSQPRSGQLSKPRATSARNGGSRRTAGKPGATSKTKVTSRALGRLRPETAPANRRPTGRVPSMGPAGPSSDSVAVKAGKRRATFAQGHGGSHLSVKQQHLLARVGGLLICSVDTKPKPILFNSRIERIASPSFDVSALPWATMTADELLSSPQDKMEAYLTSLYEVIGGSASKSIAQRIAGITFFRRLCHDNAMLAEAVANSNMMHMLLRVLKVFKNAILRTHLLTLIGVLIMNAARIDDRLQEHKVMQLLSSTLRDREVKVRRRGAAALGELIFYVANVRRELLESKDNGHVTKSAKGAYSRSVARHSRSGGRRGSHQQNRRSSSSAANAAIPRWVVPGSTLSIVVRALKPGEDEVVQHYCVKAIESVLTHSPAPSPLLASYPAVVDPPASTTSSASSTASNDAVRSDSLDTNPARWFATTNVLTSLLYIYAHTKREALQVTCGSCLFHLTRHDEGLLQQLVTKTGSALSPFSSLLPRRSAQQTLPALNVILWTAQLALCRPNVPRVGATLSADVSLVKGVVGCLEHSSSVVRAKALLILCVLGSTDPRWITRFCDAKLVAHMERVANEQHKHSYLRKCMEVFTVLVRSWLAPLAQNMKGVIQNIVSTGRTRVVGATEKQYKRRLVEFRSLQHLILSTAMRERIVTAPLLSEITDMVGLLFKLRAELPQFRQQLLATIEALSAAPSLLLKHSKSIACQLLPSLVHLLTGSELVDFRFTSLKVFSDILLPLLRDEGVYAPRSHSADTTTVPLNQLIVQELLTNFSILLRDNDPIPQYALKLLDSIIELNPAFIKVLHHLNLTSQILHSFDPLQRNHNVHNVRLVRRMIASQDIEMDFFYGEGLPSKVVSVLSRAVANNIEWFYEPLLDITYELCFHASTTVLSITKPTDASSTSTSMAVVIAATRQLLRAKEDPNAPNATTVNSQLDIDDHVGLMIESVLSHTQPLLDCVEHLFALVHGATGVDQDRSASHITHGQNTGSTGGSNDTSNSGANAGELVVPEKAAHCLLLLARLHIERHDTFLTPSNISALAWALELPGYGYEVSLASKSPTAKRGDNTQFRYHVPPSPRRVNMEHKDANASFRPPAHSLSSLSLPSPSSRSAGRHRPTNSLATRPLPLPLPLLLRHRMLKLLWCIVRSSSQHAALLARPEYLYVLAAVRKARRYARALDALRPGTSPAGMDIKGLPPDPNRPSTAPRTVSSLSAEVAGVVRSVCKLVEKVERAVEQHE